MPFLLRNAYDQIHTKQYFAAVSFSKRGTELVTLRQMHTLIANKLTLLVRYHSRQEPTRFPVHQPDILSLSLYRPLFTEL